jgi:ubiquinone/menaquinone biosynthesis C-methylase UbiE
MKQKLLNLGCGSFIHEEWTNVDFVSTNENVIPYNLLLGIPFNSNTFDAVYHSHVLEHFKKSSALFFIKECYRVLKPGGCLRVVVPDFESLCGEYLKLLKLALDGSDEAKLNYDWIVVEILDQISRDEPGGEMAKVLMQDYLPNLDYIESRIGIDVREKILAGKQGKNCKSKKRNILFRLLKSIFGKHIDYYRIGKFRSSGETHKWMYDRYSLSRLLLESGFKEIQIKNAYESNISNFSQYNFDVYKGNKRGVSSLFIEALK